MDGVDDVNVENNLVLREILQASPVDIMQASQRFRFSEADHTAGTNNANNSVPLTAQAVPVVVPAWAKMLQDSDPSCKKKSRATQEHELRANSASSYGAKSFPERQSLPLYAATLSKSNLSPEQRRDFDSSYRAPKPNTSIHPISAPRRPPTRPESCQTVQVSRENGKRRRSP